MQGTIAGRLHHSRRLLNLSNVHCVGRNGMHKYNQDHAMMTSILTVANMYEGRNFNIWEVNENAEVS